jgi:glycosyltransferase involved in cell wall biosynthesis
MNLLIIVATDTHETRGGISRALAAYEHQFGRSNIEFVRVNSHSDMRSRTLSWLKAWCQVTQLAYTYRSNATFWFHCGPWLSMLRKATLAITANTFGCKTIAHLHSPSTSDYLASNTASIFLRAFFKCFDGLIVLTPWWKTLLEERKVKCPIYVCGNPVSDQLLQLARYNLQQVKNIELENSSFTVLSMARLIPGKGIELVIDAARYLPEMRLNIAGEGPLLPVLQASVERYDLSNRVRFLGWLNEDEKIQAFEQADLFCLPSRYDSFGVVFIESMACNVPVIACNWGPVGDVVTRDVGILVPDNDVDALVETIIYMRRHIEQFINHGPQRVVDNYSAEACVINLQAILKRFDDDARAKQESPPQE